MLENLMPEEYFQLSLSFCSLLNFFFRMSTFNSNHFPPRNEARIITDKSFLRTQLKCHSLQGLWIKVTSLYNQDQEH